MLIIGLIVFAAAVASAVIVIVQNRGSVVGVHVLGHTWTGHLYWVLVAGLIMALVGVVGLAILRGGAARASAGGAAGRESAAERAGPRPGHVVLLRRHRPG